MAGAGVRTIRAIKPHVPLIRFPDRKSKGSINMAASPSPNLSKSTKVALTSSIEWEDLPAKYHRKSLTLEEMEYIERGGPV